VTLPLIQAGLTSPSPDSVPTDPYQVLGVNPQASHGEIKAAYRALVKRHHPDAGGDAATMLAVNAAWEVLGDRQQRHRFDQVRRDPLRGPSAAAQATASGPGRSVTKAAAASDEELALWLQQVYGPVDRLLGQVVNPFPAQLRALAADPYDDSLMEVFCAFLEQSQARLARAETLYRSLPCPPGLQEVSLDLYHTLSLIKDALLDLERFTMGYVDSYLRDGRELLRQARSRRSQLKQRCRQLRA
jgi:molecular chaperone DnaJ